MKGEVKGKVIFNWRKNHDSLEIHPRRCPFYLLKAKAVELRVEIAKREKKGSKSGKQIELQNGAINHFARFALCLLLCGKCAQHGRNAKCATPFIRTLPSWRTVRLKGRGRGGGGEGWEKPNIFFHSIYRNSFLLNRFYHRFFRRYRRLLSHRVITLVSKWFIPFAAGNCFVRCLFRRRWRRWVFICRRQRRWRRWEVLGLGWWRGWSALAVQPAIVIFVLVAGRRGTVDAFAQVEYTVLIDFAIIQGIDGVLTAIRVVHGWRRSKVISRRHGVILWARWNFCIDFEDARVKVTQKASLRARIA